MVCYFQAAGKILTWTTHHENIKYVIYFVEKIVKVNQHSFEDCLRLSVLILKNIAVCYTGALLAFPLIALVLYIYTNESQIVLPMYIPGIDETTKMGFWIVTSYHAVNLIYAVIGSFGPDLVLVGATLNALGLTKALKMEIDCLSIQTKGNKDINVLETQLFVRNIVFMHIDIRG